MARKQVHIRLTGSNHEYLKELTDKYNQSNSEVINDIIEESRKYQSLKKSLQWTNDQVESIYEMVNYLALEMQYRLAREFAPRLSDHEESMIIKMLDSKRKQERGYIRGRDHYQE